jgi:hypothetical protein
MQEERAEQRTWYRGAVTGYLTQAEYVEALAHWRDPTKKVVRTIPLAGTWPPWRAAAPVRTAPHA